MNESQRSTLITLTGALGCLLVASDAELAVSVSDSDGETLKLAPAGDGVVPFTADDRGLAMLETGSPRGVVRMLGHAAPAGDGSIRFAVVDVLEISQRRSSVRRRAARPIFLETQPGGIRVESFALDMSGGGLLLAGADQLEPEQRVSFRMRLERAGPAIEGQARVVRVDAQGRRAIAFESLADDDRERIIHFIFERERAEIREARDGQAD